MWCRWIFQGLLTLNHTIVLSKLTEFGIFAITATTATYKISERYILSQLFVGTSDVPLGSDLGPVLFLLFIEDFTKTSAVFTQNEEYQFYEILKLSIIDVILFQSILLYFIYLFIQFCMYMYRKFLLFRLSKTPFDTKCMQHLRYLRRTL